MKKQHIPTSLKKQIWKKQFGKCTEGTCYVCNTKIGIPRRIGKNTSLPSAEYGHIKAEKEGGKVTSTNLKLICKKCNVTMGTHNLEQFKENIVPYMDFEEDKTEMMHIDTTKCLLCNNKIKEGIFCHIHMKANITIAT